MLVPATGVFVGSSGEAQPLADAQALSFREHGMAKSDIRERQPSVPEQVGFIIILASGLQTGNDLPEFGVEGFL